MANKKMIAMLAGLMALTVSGGSFAAYAADNGIANTTNQADYSYVTGQENGVQYADAEGVDEDADKSDFSFNKGQARAESYRQDSGDDADNVNYSCYIGRQEYEQQHETWKK